MLVPTSTNIIGSREFKRLITEPTLMIERKGIDAQTVDNFTHLILATNNDWSFPAGMDERRVFALQVSDARKGHYAYFGALAAEIEGLTSVTDQEIERAIALTETGLVRQIEQVGERADLLSMFDQLFDDPERLNGELDRLRAVTPADVSAFVDRFLSAENRAVLTYVPVSENAPTGDTQ